MEPTSARLDPLVGRSAGGGRRASSGRGGNGGELKRLLVNTGREDRLVVRRNGEAEDIGSVSLERDDLGAGADVPEPDLTKGVSRGDSSVPEIVEMSVYKSARG